MSNTNKRNKGLNGLFILFCIFLVLKLTHVINWSWWLVCLPLAIEIALVVAISVSVGVLAAQVVRRK